MSKLMLCLTFVLVAISMATAQPAGFGSPFAPPKTFNPDAVGDVTKAGDAMKPDQDGATKGIKDSFGQIGPGIPSGETLKGADTAYPMYYYPRYPVYYSGYPYYYVK